MVTDNMKERRYFGLFIKELRPLGCRACQEIGCLHCSFPEECTGMKYETIWGLTPEVECILAMIGVGSLFFAILWILLYYRGLLL